MASTEKVSKITQQYLNKGCIDYLLSPTLGELFTGYNPKFSNGNLIWIKKEEK